MNHSDEIPLENPKNSVLSKILGIFIFATLAFAGYGFWQEKALHSKIEKKQDLISRQELQIRDFLEKEKIEEKNQSKLAWEKLSKQQILWSDWIRKILEDLEKPAKVEFTEVKTDKNLGFIVSGIAEDLKSIARLILIVDKHDRFKNPFVVNLSRDEASQKYTFMLTFDAQK